MDPKTRGIVAYLTIIGLIIAIVTNEPKDEQASFHIRQSLGLFIICFGASFLFFIPFLPLLVWMGGVVFWVIGFVGALQGIRKPVPLLGTHFQEWFKAL